MKELIVLTRKEYDELLKKTIVDENYTIVSKEDLAYLEACEYSLEAFTKTEELCPNCKKAIIIDGFVCPSCGYDKSYSVKEWRKIHNMEK